MTIIEAPFDPYNEENIKLAATALFYPYGEAKTEYKAALLMLEHLLLPADADSCSINDYMMYIKKAIKNKE